MSESNGSGTSALSVGLSGLLSVSQACRIAGCCPNTLRKWCQLGLPTYRIGESSHSKRRFLRDDLLTYLGLEKNKKENDDDVGGKILAYARVSTGGQARGFYKGEENDLKRQIDRIKNYCRDNYQVEPRVFSDIGSGLSYTRKGLVRLLKEILGGQHDGSILLVTTKDRWARFGTEVLELICQVHSVKIVYTEKEEEQTETQELQDDLLSIIHVFSSRQLGMRSAKRLTKHLSSKALERVIALRQSGMAISRISDIVNGEGLRTNDGAAISVAVIRRHLQEKPQLETKNEKNSIERYYCDCIEHGDHNLRLRKSDLYAHYVQWAKFKAIDPVSITMAGRQLLALGLRETRVSDPIRTTVIAWVGIKIRGEQLAYTVKCKPRKKPPQTAETNNFVRFYKEKLEGRFSGYRKEMDRQYLAWCQQNNLKKISLKEIPKILMEQGGHYPTNRKEGFIYDLTKKPPTYSSSNS